MPDVSAVMDQALAEVKTLGGNVKAIHESVQKELATIRSEVEGLSKGQVTDALVQSKIDAFGASIGTKIEAAQEAATKAAAEAAKAVDVRVDAVETAMRRSAVPGAVPEDAKALREAAVAFTKSAAALAGRKVADVLDDGDIDFEGYKAYRKNFGLYLRRDERALSPDHWKALSSGSDPDGGYLIEPTVSARILAKIYESSPIRQLAAVETISGTELEIRVDHDEVDFEWVGETDLPNAGKTPQLGKKRIVAHTMAARPKATQQLLEDASVDVAAWLDNKVSAKFARGENAAFLLGSGRGMPRGLLTYPAGTSGETVEQIATGSATGFTFDGIINTIYALKEGYHSRATWLMQRASIGKVMLVKDGDNTFVFKNVLMPGARGLETTLSGYPLRMAADVPAVATNALCAVFGDIGAAYQIVDRLGVTTQRDPYTAKPFVEFYTRRRVGGDVVNFEAFKLMKAAA
jgi:HK97 family phage major capsid protein